MPRGNGPIRTIILRVSQEEFEEYEALKRPKESWENMFDRVTFGEAPEQITTKEPPPGWVVCDGKNGTPDVSEKGMKRMRKFMLGDE